MSKTTSQKCEHFTLVSLFWACCLTLATSLSVWSHHHHPVVSIHVRTTSEPRRKSTISKCLSEWRKNIPTSIEQTQDEAGCCVECSELLCFRTIGVQLYYPFTYSNMNLIIIIVIVQTGRGPVSQRASSGETLERYILLILTSGVLGVIFGLATEYCFVVQNLCKLLLQHHHHQ